MRTKHFTDALTYHAEKLISQSVIKPLLFIKDPEHSFDIYRPLHNDEIENKPFSDAVEYLINTLLEVMVVNREAYFAQFKEHDDLIDLYEMGYQNPDKVTFLLFKSDFDKASAQTQKRFIIQQQLKSNNNHLN